MKTKTNPHRTHFTLMTALAGCATFLISGCASTTTAPTAEPDATVRIKEWSAAYYGSATGGNGTLNFNGAQRDFKITGFGAGGAGGQSIKATGKVYNLSSLSQFEGTYQGVSNGITLIHGKMHAKLTNGNGVVMYLAGETDGFASSTGLQSYTITFRN